MDPNTLTTIAMIALMIVAFYFLILRPQRKRQAAQAKTLESLTPGSRVLTSTGIYGNLLRIGDKQAVIELTPGTEMTMVKHAIVRVVQPGEEDLESEGLSSSVDDDVDREVSDNEFSSGAAAGGTNSSANWQEFPVGADEATAAEKPTTDYPSYAPKGSEAVESDPAIDASAADVSATDADVTDADGTKRN